MKKLAVPFAVLRSIVRSCADLLAPASCCACDERSPVDGPLCGPCADALSPPDRARTDGVLAAYRFEDPLRGAIHALKYEGRSDRARGLGELLAPHVRDLAVDVVVPVPLHPTRLVDRGYNQAGLLALHAARAAGARLDTSSVARVRVAPPQARSSRAERLANVAACFAVRAPSRLRGRRVLVVDDVVTTGATFAACASVIEGAGASSVACIALATAPESASAKRAGV